MFEESQKKSRIRRLGWAGIVLIVAILVAVIQLVRINPPKTLVDVQQHEIWTEGSIIDGPSEINANGYLSFRLNLNHRSTLDGYFRTGSDDRRVACVIIRETDLDRWLKGDDVQKFSSMGAVPRGTITKVLEAGKYLIILDNRSGKDEISIDETRFSVE